MNLLDPALVADDLRTLAEALLVLALGGAVGWERQAAGKSAGLRTMMLVTLSSFLFVKVSLVTTALTGQAADPARAVQAIATGLAFLGGGIVFHEGNRSRGLTTAATVLAVAPVGIAVALDRVVLAVGTTLLLLFVLRVLDRVETRVFKDHRDA